SELAESAVEVRSIWFARSAGDFRARIANFVDLAYDFRALLARNTTRISCARGYSVRFPCEARVLNTRSTPVATITILRAAIAPGYDASCMYDNDDFMAWSPSRSIHSNSLRGRRSSMWTAPSYGLQRLRLRIKFNLVVIQRIVALIQWKNGACLQPPSTPTQKLLERILITGRRLKEEHCVGLVLKGRRRTRAR
ncbi:hypothetical protein PENSPDRAFT_671903, partial [Peniophora sp. CONT]